MMAEREAMTSKMKAMDEKLDQLVSSMEAAGADLRVDATDAVIGALVAQHKAMREMAKTNGRMMGHMMKHMRPEEIESTPKCLMIREVAAEAPEMAPTSTAWPLYSSRSSAANERWSMLADDFHRHIQILPRLTHETGFEAGSGLYANTVAPEQAAAALGAPS